MLVEDHPVVLMGIRTVLAATDQLRIVGECATYACALQCARSLAPDLVVLPLRLEGALMGTALCREIVGLDPRPGVLIYTATDDAAEATSAYLAGADSFLHKAASAETLADAAVRTASGERIWRTSRRQPTLEEFDPGQHLTPRERDVLALMLERRSNQEISDSLVVGLPTVKTHVGNILAKLGLKSRLDLF